MSNNEIWADRVVCAIVRGKDKADPSSVAFEAMERALQEDFGELVLVDTAGRLILECRSWTSSRRSNERLEEAAFCAS